MIIFDTNAVRLLNPSSDKADLIRKLRASGQHVAVPSMVLVELAAQQVIKYRDAYSTVKAAIEKLQAVTPETLGLPGGPVFQPDEVEKYWVQQYGDLFQVIETTPEMAVQALAREAHGLKPAKRVRNDKDGDVKSGARDVAIWLTVIDYLRSHPAEQAYFVTANTADFGEGWPFASPMDEDASGFEGRLTLLNGWDDVVGKFTTQVEATLDTREILRSDRLVQAIQLEAKERMRDFLGIASWMPGPGVSWAIPDGPLQLEEWAAPPLAALLNIDEIVGHEIGDATWYTASTTWLLSGIALDVPDLKVAQMTVKWPVKVLFSTSEHPPVVISSGSPILPDLRDGSADREARRDLGRQLAAMDPVATMTAKSLEGLLRLLAADSDVQKPLLPSQLQALRNSYVHGRWKGAGPHPDPTPNPEN